MVVSKVSKMFDLWVRLMCSDRVFIFIMVWGFELLLFVMVEEKDYLFA